MSHRYTDPACHSNPTTDLFAHADTLGNVYAYGYIHGYTYAKYDPDRYAAPYRDAYKDGYANGYADADADGHVNAKCNPHYVPNPHSMYGE